MPRETILSVEDDERLQVVVREYLEQDGYKILSAANGADMLAKLATSAPDVILLDLHLPDKDGETLIGSIRDKSNARIIVVSGKNETVDRILCLEMGADDYLTKPFEMRELSARIKAVLRRNAPPDPRAKTSTDPSHVPKILFRNWCLDRLQYQVVETPGNRPAGLTTGEFKLLEALALAPNRVLSREQLFEMVGNGNYDVYDRAIDIHIARIRKKLGETPDLPLIKTVRGVGYMFCAETTPVN